MRVPYRPSRWGVVNPENIAKVRHIYVQCVCTVCMYVCMYVCMDLLINIILFHVGVYT